MFLKFWPGARGGDEGQPDDGLLPARLVLMGIGIVGLRDVGQLTGVAKRVLAAGVPLATDRTRS